MKIRNCRAFTLLELLIVIAILGLLALLIAANINRPLTNTELEQRNDNAIATVQAFEVKNGRDDGHNFIVSEVQTEMGTMTLVIFSSDKDDTTQYRFVDPETQTVMMSDNGQVMPKTTSSAPDE